MKTFVVMDSEEIKSGKVPAGYYTSQQQGECIMQYPAEREEDFSYFFEERELSDDLMVW